MPIVHRRTQAGTGAGSRRLPMGRLFLSVPLLLLLFAGCMGGPSSLPPSRGRDASGAPGPGGTRLGGAASPELSMPGVPQFAKVSEGLYRGGQPTEQGFIALKRIGVKTIVSLRVLDSDREFVDSIGLNHLHLSVKHLHPEDEDVLAFLKVATDTANQPVFVHCRDGVDRTGMMVAVYRILVQDWSKQDAIEEMRSMGFNEIWDQIEDYIEELDVDRMKRELRRITAPDEEAPN